MWSRQTMLTALCLACPPKTPFWPHNASPSRITQTGERASPGDPSHTQAAPPPRTGGSAAGPWLHCTSRGQGGTAVSGRADGYEHRSLQAPRDCLGSDQDQGSQEPPGQQRIGSLAPQEPTLPPCSTWSVSLGSPACVQSSPPEDGTRKRGLREERGVRRGISEGTRVSPVPAAQLGCKHTGAHVL